jgi:hypothetical protein
MTPKIDARRSTVRTKGTPGESGTGRECRNGMTQPARFQVLIDKGQKGQ